MGVCHAPMGNGRHLGPWEEYLYPLAFLLLNRFDAIYLYSENDRSIFFDRRETQNNHNVKYWGETHIYTYITGFFTYFA